MSEGPTFACPYCDRQYGFKPELEGKKVRCKCGEKFSIKAPEPDDVDPYDIDDDGPDWSHMGGSSDEPQDEAEAQRVPCPSCGSSIAKGAAICINCGKDVKSGKRIGETRVLPGEKATRHETISAVRTKITGIGLGIHGLGYLLLILGIMVLAAGGAQIARGSSSGEVIALVGGIATVIGLPMMILGPLLSLAAPADAGRMLLIASIAFYLGGTVFIVLIELGVLHEWFSVAQSIPFLIGAGCFLGFLQKLSLFLDDDSLYQQTEFLLKTFFLIVILTLLMFVPILGCLAVVVALIAQVVFAIAYAWAVCQAAIAAIKMS